MPRLLTLAQRNAIEDPHGTEVWLTFVRITHPDLALPERYVTEGDRAVSMQGGAIINYNLAGELYDGYPFGFEWVSDDDRIPRAKITAPDVSGDFGRRLRPLRSPPSLEMWIYPLSDWDLTTLDSNNARSPVGTPGALLHVRRLRLRQLGGDFVFEARLTPPDPTSEPWPFIRATLDRVPGLFT